MIGSWVSDQKGKYYQIENGRQLDEWDFNYYAIPLTEEWLIKFGFEKDNTFFYFIPLESVNKQLIIIGDEARISMVYRNGIMTVANNIKHVHRLQNIFWCLTGQGLTIKI